ncbi:phytanoyl-CoA dioxygenase family protein [Streptomyces aidingensis]|uniref:Phytanoyl-CoA dioxygenase (PhyH) n=1 Tax=Streptomyces aidingensis TaxID=910347 RepID=A0A1I1KMZ8_9ACTN|nr:phytanoyl-CoA dioxygenase family protein [Streptomyces aidingensis]SFC62147.1 Phytanoyl-CoA dioxygenase (PhyH) [Streptomyces aidingensis]
MLLNEEEKARFKRDGAIIRRAQVPDQLTAPARELIEGWYREAYVPERIAAYTQRTFAPELGSEPALLDLFHRSGVRELAVDLLGTVAPVTTVQIQLRLPDAEVRGAQPEKAMHVDGVACPHLDPRELRTFSLLVGVVLSEIDDPAGGALHYVPGGHLRMAEWFGSAWSLGITEQTPPEIGTEQGVPLLGGPGDLLLMHHLVPHAVGRNLTSRPRAMAYFRVSHPNHAGRRLEALRNPWLDYPPLATPDARPATR